MNKFEAYLQEREAQEQRRKVALKKKIGLGSIGAIALSGVIFAFGPSATPDADLPATTSPQAEVRQVHYYGEAAQERAAIQLPEARKVEYAQAVEATISEPTAAELINRQPDRKAYITTESAPEPTTTAAPTRKAEPKPQPKASPSTVKAAPKAVAATPTAVAEPTPEPEAAPVSAPAATTPQPDAAAIAAEKEAQRKEQERLYKIQEARKAEKAAAKAAAEAEAAAEAKAAEKRSLQMYTDFTVSAKQVSVGAMINFVVDQPRKDYTYSFDFGDRSRPYTGIRTSYNYLEPGRYVVTVTATTPEGKTITSKQRIRVK